MNKFIGWVDKFFEKTKNYKINRSFLKILCYNDLIKIVRNKLTKNSIVLRLF